MSDRRITLFELHSHGPVQIGPGSLPGIGDREAAERAEAARAREEEEEAGGTGLVPKLLLAAVVVAGAALAVRKFRGGDEDVEEREQVPLAESDQISATANADD